MQTRVQTLTPSYPTFLLKFATVLVIALVFTLADAMAASGVSPKFDGRYAGMITPTPAVSASGCQPATVNAFVVRGGYIRPSGRIAATLAPAFEGFVSGHMRQGNFQRPFEARIVHDEGGVALSGGVTDGETGCAWLVQLRRIGD